MLASSPPIKRLERIVRFLRSVRGGTTFERTRIIFCSAERLSGAVFYLCLPSTRQARLLPGWRRGLASVVSPPLTGSIPTASGKEVAGVGSHPVRSGTVVPTLSLLECWPLRL